ncbi:general stress protein [Arthrobacter woluwensis]|uniref:general stress protein n=1 Tax=Arthrobacter woluwensis TaxID=156980 RepID=UPI001FBAD46E|nr:hypothetical protein [Arthrobacter woluwensis]
MKTPRSWPAAEASRVPASSVRRTAPTPQKPAARQGGQNSPGQFGAENGADPSEAGRQGGQNSPGQFGAENGADPSEAGRQGGQNSHGGNG